MRTIATSYWPPQIFGLSAVLLLQKNRSQKGISVRRVRLGWAVGGGHLRARSLIESFELGADGSS